MNPMTISTVGDIRKAIEGVSDTMPIFHLADGEYGCFPTCTMEVGKRTTPEAVEPIFVISG